MPEETWRHWFQQNFDKLILICLYVGLVNLVWIMIWLKANGDQVNWVREAAGTVLGALLGLITGASLRRSTNNEPAHPAEKV